MRRRAEQRPGLPLRRPLGQLARALAKRRQRRRVLVDAPQRLLLVDESPHHVAMLVLPPLGGHYVAGEPGPHDAAYVLVKTAAEKRPALALVEFVHPLLERP